MTRPSKKLGPEAQRDAGLASIDLRLLPVVELAPSDYGSAPMPAFTGRPWTVEENEGYWRACLGESGITGVDPIVPGSWLVGLEALGSREPLVTVLAAHLKTGIPADLDQLETLAGGFVLVDGKEVLSLPQCCGDLGDLENWRRAAEQRTASPETLWIGHPWLSTWYRAPMLHIREVPEHHEQEPKEFAVAPEELLIAVFEAERAIDRFRDRVITLLRERRESFDAEAVADILVGILPEFIEREP